MKEIDLMCKALSSLVVAIVAAVVFVLPAWAVADPSQLVKSVTAEVVGLPFYDPDNARQQ